MKYVLTCPLLFYWQKQRREAESKKEREGREVERERVNIGRQSERRRGERQLHIKREKRAGRRG